MPKTNYHIKVNENREKLYAEWCRLTGENFCKSVDGAVELALSLYGCSQDLAQTQIVRIVPKRYLTKFLIKEMER